MKVSEALNFCATGNAEQECRAVDPGLLDDDMIARAGKEEFDDDEVVQFSLWS
jgi:hypothetical protein